jgi:hypothetical protein
MNESPNMRDRLLSAGSVDPGLKEQYEKEMKNLLNAELTLAQRWLYGALSGVLLLLGIGFGYVSGAMSGVDIVIRLFAIVASVKCVAEAIRIGLIVYQGRVDRTKSGKWVMGGIYLFVLSVLWLVYAMRAGQTGTGSGGLILMFLPILAVIIWLTTGWVLHRINVAELRNREELLEVKLQLTGIARQLEEKGQ